ncbi:MAG: hypothetical protein ACW976_02505 [Candidatus Ranarchaeia archaeon]|jgi:hypothetical protein
MVEEKNLTKSDWHKKMAKELFNLTWTFLDKAERTQEEDDKMLHAAHASRFHWGEVGKPVHLGRGEWQISRVYAVLKKPESALYHAQRYLDISKEHNLDEFDHAYAYEALARAAAIKKDTKKTQQYLDQAKKHGEKIKEKESRDMLLDDLKSI